MLVHLWSPPVSCLFWYCNIRYINPTTDSSQVAFPLPAFSSSKWTGSIQKEAVETERWKRPRNSSEREPSSGWAAEAAHGQLLGGWRRGGWTGEGRSREDGELRLKDGWLHRAGGKKLQVLLAESIPEYCQDFRAKGLRHPGPKNFNSNHHWGLRTPLLRPFLKLHQLYYGLGNPSVFGLHTCCNT